MVRPIIGLFVCTLVAPDAAAQNVWVGAAIAHATHRFNETPDADRLDGAAPGLVVAGGVRIWRHLAARIEWSRDGEMTDVESLTLDVAGRTVTIDSTVAQRTRAFTALGGFTHALSSRATIAYLIGAAFTRVDRRFETNAPGLILPAAPSSARSIQQDESVALAGGVDALIRLNQALSVMTGLRLQALHLDPEISARRVSVFAGLAWVF
jgi:hypothetical protein